MGKQPLESVVGELLREQGLTLGIAESSTGGLVGHRITQVSGSSDYFVGSIVPYARRLLEQLVGVAHATLAEYGVVSEETAREMARGVRRRLGPDIGLSITGIAGPYPGRSKKPVGLTYIGLSAEDIEVCERHIFAGNRSENKERSAEAALDLLKRYLDRRAELSELQRVVDGVDSEGAPQLVIISSAKTGITRPAIRNTQYAIRNRLGVLSGAFDPLTTAHVRMAELALQEYQLNEAMLELSKVNVDKSVYGASLAERLWMLTHFVQGRPRFSVAMCSHARFVDKAKAIRTVYPEGIEIYFIVGYDTLVRVFDPKYYRNPEAELEEVFEQSQFIAANRGTHDLADIESFLEQPVCRPYAHRVHVMELDSLHASMSSTQVRERLKQGHPVGGLVPDEVLPLLPLTGLTQTEQP